MLASALNSDKGHNDRKQRVIKIGTDLSDNK